MDNCNGHIEGEPGHEEIFFCPDCLYTKLQVENNGLKKQARCPCGEELEGLGYGQDGSVIYECNKCKSQINISKEAWQARKGNSNDD